MFNGYKKIIKYLSALVIIGITTAGNVQAQLGDAGEILRAGADDANILLTEYLTPVGNGFGAGLNTGWNQMARPHKKLGFSLSIRASAVMVPDSDLMFDITQAGLTNIETSDPTVTDLNTFSGEKSGTSLDVYARNVAMPDGSTQDVKMLDFEMPGGVGVNIVPVPIAQLSIGLIKDTEIGLRYMPALDFGGDIPAISLFGLNFKHGINQWIPGGGVLPVDLALQGAFTNFGIDADFEVAPETNANTTQESIDNFSSTHWDSQGMSLDANAWNINVLVGKEIPFIGGYVGLGIEESTFNLSADGNYPLLVPAPTIDNQDRNELNSISDPIDVEIEGKNSIRAILGLRLSLGPFKINAEYTAATYSTVSAGIAISIR